MSSDIAIEVKNLSKSYQIYEKPYDRLKQSIFPRLNQLFGKVSKQYFREFSALKDVSFEVRRGETVGIIGRNGSGKSTLLQMICGTLNPTQGSVLVNGRVAALLELGAGFNPEFTGRENVYTNGALLGLSRDEIGQKFNAILAFADIGLFIDQPVKTYSSGMFVRLAFAIAANLEPDILIIDEALAVGDMAFQAKCMARLRALMDKGTTILFVSHDLGSVRNLCSRVLWLKSGYSECFGDVEEITRLYTADLHLSVNADLAAQDLTLKNDLILSFQQVAYASLNQLPESSSFSEGWSRYGDSRAIIKNVEFLNSNRQKFDSLDLKEKFLIRFLVQVNETLGSPALGFSFRDLKGNQIIGSLSTNYFNLFIPPMVAGNSYIVEISGVNLLAQGVYSLNLGIENIVAKNIAHEFVDVVENAIVFRSIFGGGNENIFPAMVWQEMQFNVKVNPEVFKHE